MSATTAYDLYIPELGIRRPFRATLPCPERLYVAWHRDCEGIHELLDERGHRHGHPPQDRYWEVREYERAFHYPEAFEAFYERADEARP
jgi:hypothetical protein